MLGRRKEGRLTKSPRFDIAAHPPTLWGLMGPQLIASWAACHCCGQSPSSLTRKCKWEASQFYQEVPLRVCQGWKIESKWGFDGGCFHFTLSWQKEEPTLLEMRLGDLKWNSRMLLAETGVVWGS